nr:MAG TPA: hypothetical protein [Caudoviricetes sp.]
MYFVLYNIQNVLSIAFLFNMLYNLRGGVLLCC